MFGQDPVSASTALAGSPAETGFLEGKDPEVGTQRMGCHCEETRALSRFDEAISNDADEAAAALLGVNLKAFA